MTTPFPSSCDVLIIGAGIFGTSTAYHLAKSYHDPSRITVINRASTPFPQAASYDINKIVRADYSKPFYMDLAYEAMHEWLNDPILSRYYHNTGWIMLDEKGSDLAARIRQNFKISGKTDTSSHMSLDEVKSSWGGVLSGVDTSDFEGSYHNSSAGWADASLAVAAWMKEAICQGINYIEGDAELVADASGLVQARVNNQTYTSTKILLATGAWTPYMLAPVERALDIPPKISIERQMQAAGVCVTAFKLNDVDSEYYSQMPILIYGRKGEVMPPNHDGLFKFTNAHTFLNTVECAGKQISVPHPDQEAVPMLLKAQSIDLVRKRIPQIIEQQQPDQWRLCWDAVSPDQNQLICKHPIISNLYFATAGSFHSWKFLPNIGKYVVNVLNDQSNGKDKDETWCWKHTWSEHGAHPKVAPRGQLRDFGA